MSIVIIDREASRDFKDKLEDLGYQVLETIDLPDFQTSLRSHPDIQVAKVGQATIVVEPRTYSYYKKALQAFNIDVLKGQTIVKDTYPLDISYNIAYDGRTYFHNFSHTDPVILDIIGSQDKVQIKQGYSKCSIAYINGGIITADMGIYKQVKAKAGYEDSLLIRPGHIGLQGYDYGFIGGASGYDQDLGRLYFLGNVTKHPDGSKILAYLKKKGQVYQSLGGQGLVDHGSLVFL